jgi:hypothetical protein
MPIDKAEPRFWGSYKGRVIKSISIDGARTWKDIQELTGISPKTLNIVLHELFDLKAITGANNKEYRVALDLYKEYKEYFSTSGPAVANSLKVKEEDQINMRREFQNFLSMKKLILADNHTFLEGSRLNDLTSHLIENVRTELLIVNPFIDKANMVNDMKGSAQKGRRIRLLIRPPEGKEKCDQIDKFQEYGLEILTNPSIHAKIMVFDRGVAIISSMNLYAFSVGGGSWEAGIATCSEDVLNDVLNGINMKFEEKETCSWK